VDLAVTFASLAGIHQPSTHLYRSLIETTEKEDCRA
jgi:hypothetical protein